MYATPVRGRRRVKLAKTCVVLGGLLVSSSNDALADNSGQAQAAPPAREDLTFVDHGAMDTFWLGGQMNAIFQAHPTFPSPYSGTNSFQPKAEAALSGLITGFFAYAPWRGTELIVDPEMALGGGLSQTLGAAGFPNLDVVRNPSLSHAPYVARAEIHQVVPLSRAWVTNEDRGPLASLSQVPRRRLEFRIGKLSTVDLFDVNPAGSDSHLQFMNWTVDNNGAFDYAADTRGYTYGFVVEYKGPGFAARLGEMLMPKVANGIDLDFDIRRSRAENLEIEVKYLRESRWAGVLRILAYRNLANMGSYEEAVARTTSMPAMVPDIVATRRRARSKWGWGANVVQALAGRARCFGRLGWNDGRSESFAYTEADNSVEIGADVDGASWRRPYDRVGLALVTNGISDVHRAYLRGGGLGFLLGDGTLSYAREIIAEHYYNAHLWRGLFLAEDVQLIANPGYNSDRGPIWVLSARVHLEL